ncbi:transposase InsO family protein [Comamonas sp. BIGb0152]|nr:transposase InsO family protein [Comamonas sp. BIGb0152]
MAVDSATRLVFVHLKTANSAAGDKAFLRILHNACPIKITRLLIDSSKQFADRLSANRQKEPSDNYEPDLLCDQLCIEHRLTPRRTNGMMELFNGRIADVLKTHRFNSSEDLEQTLMHYVALYNHQLPQSALQSKTPMQAMKQWHQTHAELFNKQLYDRPGCNMYS